MTRYFFKALIGGIIFFIWNAISWMGLPFHGSVLQTLPETFVQQEVTLASGVYHYPGLDDENLAKRLAEGPRIPLMVYIEGATPMFDPLSFLGSFFYNLITAMFLLIVLMKLGNKNLRSVVSSAVLIGLIIGFASDFPQMNWFMFPMNYTLINVADHLVGFTLLGLYYGWRIEKSSQTA